MAQILGIDPGSRKLAFVTKSGVNWAWRTAELPSPYTPYSTYKAYAETSKFISGYTHLSHAFIESPIVGRGIRATINQAMVSGAVQACLTRDSISVHMVHPGTWKKAIIGNGNAKKPDIADVILNVFDETDDQDVLDAVAIYLYGEQVVARSKLD